MILIALKDALHLVIPQQQTVMGQLLFSPLTVLRLTHSVVVTMAKIRHKRSRVLLRKHFVPVDILKPRMRHHFFNSIVSQP